MKTILNVFLIFFFLTTACKKDHLEDTLRKDDLYGIWKIVSIKTSSGKLIESDSSDISAVWAGLYINKFEIVDDGTFQIDTASYGIGHWTFDEINDSILFSRSAHPDISTRFFVKAQKDSLWLINAVDEIKSVKSSW